MKDDIRDNEIWQGLEQREKIRAVLKYLNSLTDGDFEDVVKNLADFTSDIDKVGSGQSKPFIDWLIYNYS